MKRTLKMVIAYDGTNFAGWQRQKNRRTIQGTLEQALRQVTGKSCRVIGAGRTDSGVHAEGQVAQVTLDSRLPRTILQKALNAVLPEDILIHSLKETSAGFHARYDASQKLYRYAIWNNPLRPLLNRRYVLHVPKPLNIPSMRQAAGFLKLMRDFRSFHSSGREVSSTIRRISKLTITRKGPSIFIDAQANGFLYHMMRRMVGLLLEVGKGRLTPAQVSAFCRGNKTIVPPTAPACGLHLVKIWYEK